MFDVHRLFGPANQTPNMPSEDLILSARGALREVLENVPHAVRDTLVFFFAIFLLRILLRKEWLGALAFTLLFVGVAISSGASKTDLFFTAIIYGSFALVTMRFGLLALAWNSRGYARRVRYGGMVLPILRDYASQYERDRSVGIQTIYCGAACVIAAQVTPLGTTRGVNTRCDKISNHETPFPRGQGYLAVLLSASSERLRSVCPITVLQHPMSSFNLPGSRASRRSDRASGRYRSAMFRL
jgi:hypothetical protein